MMQVIHALSGAPPRRCWRQGVTAPVWSPGRRFRVPIARPAPSPTAPSPAPPAPASPASAPPASPSAHHASPSGPLRASPRARRPAHHRSFS